MVVLNMLDKYTGCTCHQRLHLLHRLFSRLFLNIPTFPLVFYRVLGKECLLVGISSNTTLYLLPLPYHRYDSSNLPMRNRLYLLQHQLHCMSVVVEEVEEVKI